MKTTLLHAILLWTVLLCAILLWSGACAGRPGAEDAAASAVEVPPDLLDAMVADLAAEVAAEPSTIEVARAAAVTWSDAALGCPEPGMTYIQVLTEGYQVILRHAGREHDYRADRHGHFVRCQRPDRQQPL